MASDAAQIGVFCGQEYGVTFSMFDIEVNGLDAHPLYRYLTSKARSVPGTRSIK
jgi:glutathione peroxidase